MDNEQSLRRTPAPGTNLREWMVRIGLVITVGVLAYLLSRPATGWLSLPSDDFTQYWTAGRLNATGANPYSPEQLLSLEKEAGLTEQVQLQAGLRSDQPIMMWNPPWTLSVCMPFGLLDFAVSRRLWLLLHLLVILTSADWLWCFYYGPSRWRILAWVLAITFYPSLVILGLGQISSLLLLSMIGFLHFERRGNGWAAGAFAAITGIKPQLVYLFFPALLLWAIQCRRWSVLLGGIVAGLAATFIPLATNPSVLQQYWHALHNLNTPSDAISPTLGTLLRMGFGKDKVWLHMLPPMIGSLWLLYFWLRRRQDWVWAEQLPLLLLVSFLTTFYGAWTCDRVILLVPVIQAAVWTMQSVRWQVRMLGLLMYLGMDVLAPTMYYLESSSEFTWERVHPATVEMSLGWMTPALLLAYLVLKWQKNRESPPALQGPPVWEPMR
jgi:Glycosyltransferase family 87